MEKKGIDFGLRSYKNYNKKNCKIIIDGKENEIYTHYIIKNESLCIYTFINFSHKFLCL